MKTNTFFFAILYCFFCVSCNIQINGFGTCNDDGVKITRGNNPQIETVEKQLDLNLFKKIRATSVFNVQLIKSNEQSVTIVIDKNLENILDVKVKDDMLLLRLKEGEYTLNVLNAIVKIPELEYVKLSGSSKLYTVDTFSASNFKALLSGSSELSLPLSAQSAMFNLSGSCDANISMATQNLDISTTGSSNVKANGNAEILKLSTTGSSNIEATNLRTPEAFIFSTGSSNIDVFAEKRLDISATGSSRIRYSGQPIVNITTSGSASVKQK